MSRAIWQVDPAHLTPYYDDALCRAVAAAGSEVRLFTSPYLYDRALPFPTGYTSEQVYFPRLDSARLLNSPRWRRGLRAISYPLGHRAFLRRVRAERPDVVHFQWLHLPRFDRWLIAQIKQLGIPLVFTAHDIDNLFDYRRPADYARLYAQMDRIVVHTQANRQTIIARYPALADKVAVVPHIAIDFPIPSGATREQARRLLRIPDHALVGLLAGTIRPYKGIEVLVEACLLAQRDRRDLWIVIAGRCVDRTVLAQLRQLCQRSVVQTEYIPTAQMWQYHLAADFAIFPYRQVSQSGALITAMGFGLPVIASDIGGLRETVTGNGWLVPAGDVRALADTLKFVCQHSAELPQMGERSRALIRDRHSRSIVASRIASIYEEVNSCSVSSTAPTA